jgi:hypothetical protein
MRRLISFALTFIVVGVLAPIAHGQETTTVVFDGTVNFVSNQPGVTVDESIEIGTTFHGTYTLANTAVPLVQVPGSFAFYFPLAPSTGWPLRSQ